MSNFNFNALTEVQKEEYRKWAKAAIDVQDAVNASGIIFSLERCMHFLCKIDNDQELGTEWKNKHPFVVLFIDKLKSLVGDEFSKAYNYCKDLK